MIFILFLHVNYLTFYYTLYLINVKSLTASCCEKKVVNCNAHCYLNKKFNDENNKSNDGLLIEMKIKLVGFEFSDFILNKPVNNNLKYFDFYNSNKLKKYFPEIEHPPQIFNS